MARTPRTPIVVPTKPLVEATSESVGKAQVRDLSDLTKAPDSLIIEKADADAIQNKTKLEALKFNEDVLEVVLLPSADRSAPEIVTVWNNGRPFHFKRGTPVKVKRKYVEVLASAKPIEYQVSSGIDPSSKEAYNRALPTIGLKHAFSVIHDPAGARGAAWLQQILKGA